MKKDGIQTRNRKMSTKSKKGKKNQGMSGMDHLLKCGPLDKPFSTFSPPNLSPAMHTPMPTYMTGGMGGSLGGHMRHGGFMSPHTPGPHAQIQQHHGHHHTGAPAGMAGMHAPGGFPFSQPNSLSMSSSLASFSSIPSSGLNLTTNSSMVGAMA